MHHNYSISWLKVTYCRSRCISSLYFNGGHRLKLTRFRLLLLVTFLTSTKVLASDATIISDTALYERPSIASPQTLFAKAGTPVTIVSRAGSWKEVNIADGSLAWVRSYKVRNGTIIITEKEKDSGGFFSGLASLSRKASGLFSSEKKGYSFQRTATIGVRGLSEEQIKKATPNLAELRKMESYRSSRKKTQAFAQKGKLKATQLTHLPRSEAQQ